VTPALVMLTPVFDDLLFAILFWVLLPALVVYALAVVAGGLRRGWLAARHVRIILTKSRYQQFERERKRTDQ
jgi:uncharacterized membrane protein